jgi:hypothetical protein
MAGFSPFNYANGTVEWRMANANGRQTPLAAIQRWYLADANGDWGTQILVVSKVGLRGGDGACVMGYVAANEGASANQRAREISNRAASFRCGRDKPLVERGVSHFLPR